ncbi:hypothetical protein L9F63_025507 [Diploptera punctata]|uniref:Insulin-like domain-containing protein n=1 Tax=Diploptera punctata TaxID=6984 RepID=A0AAD8E4S5_DIPPU|nr:hypothetical protein L9F63_025507 [Diploptera punctata]
MRKFVASLTVILFLFLVTMVVQGSPLIRIQLCGTELADKLSEICSPYGYNDPFNHAVRFESPTPDNTSPLRLRVKRGVADECCKTGCTLYTMEQYCSEPLTPDERAKFIQQLQESRMNHIPQDDAAAGAGVPASLEMQRPERKNDLISKVRGQHDKKLRRGNNRCRCRRRRRRGKGDIEELDRRQNQIAPVIGTINPSYLGIPIILPSRIRKEEILHDFKNN